MTPTEELIARVENVVKDLLFIKRITRKEYTEFEAVIALARSSPIREGWPTEGVELPDDMRVPLHELQADLAWLVARLRQEHADDEVCGMLKDSIATRLSHIESAAYRMLPASPPPVGEWRAIDSAPKTPNLNTGAYDLLGWCPDPDAPHGGDRRVIWWEPVMEQWFGDRDMVESPTHWMPLPPPPTANQGEEPK